jgi:hypothetical protein
MGETQIVPVATGGKITTLAYLAAHPIGVAIAGGLLFSVGTYYLGKYIAKRAIQKTAATPASAN